MKIMVVVITLLICFTNTLSAQERRNPKELSNIELEKAAQHFNSAVISQATTQTALPSILHDSTRAQIFSMEIRRRQDILQQKLFYVSVFVSFAAFIIAILGFFWSLKTSHHDTKLMIQQIEHLKSIVTALDKNNGQERRET